MWLFIKKNKILIIIILLVSIVATAGIILFFIFGYIFFVKKRYNKISKESEESEESKESKEFKESEESKVYEEEQKIKEYKKYENLYLNTPKDMINKLKKLSESDDLKNIILSDVFLIINALKNNNNKNNVNIKENYTIKSIKHITNHIFDSIETHKYIENKNLTEFYIYFVLIFEEILSFLSLSQHITTYKNTLIDEDKEYNIKNWKYYNIVFKIIFDRIIQEHNKFI